MIKKVVNISDKEVLCRFIKHKRAKYLKLTIDEGGVRVTLPYRVTIRMALVFIDQKSDWIIKQLRKEGLTKGKVLGKEHYIRHKKRAELLLKDRVIEYNNHLKLPFNKIFIKRQKRQWGSCSSNLNLNFNYKLIFLPKELMDYVIVHELCHLKEMNHSPRFWSLVESIMPDYKKRKEKLQKYEIKLLG